MSAQLYSLTGIIFQKNASFGFADKPGIGLAITIDPIIIYGVFFGIVGPDPHYKDTFSGTMNDHWGESVITGLTINDPQESVLFQKKYKGRPLITYIFNKQENGMWIGKYHGHDCGNGTVKLQIKKLDQTFFDAPAAED